MVDQVTHMISAIVHRSRWGLPLLVLLGGALPGCQRNTDFGPVANPAVAAKFREALVGGASAGAGESAVVSGTGWGSLSGRFVFDGTPPEMVPTE